MNQADVQLTGSMTQPQVSIPIEAVHAVMSQVSWLHRNLTR